ncbi:diguanylate cyclase [Dactylosporangium sp. AC04546]|uniref:sensor domain-containing diguanylate cyclase n=1 Tax=Dactylosporangium sp. AC04546 TaxID=2862460 RepID=UPI001EDD8800|nr:sensor domain-containing diguanylate cyclase [Dactylosporangium sp. AC04546]WVK82505.1 diguanylate cyclase [Dactylosporangium sp. AC04546]
MERDRDMAMAAIRSVYRITGRINTGVTLAETLQLIVDAVVDGVGFGVAVANYLHPDKVYEAVAIAGSDEARDTLLGVRYPAEELDGYLERAERWGQLRYLPQERFSDAIPSWVPAEVPGATEGDDDAWHPLDALFAPLRAPDGQLVGILGVDLPADGRKPGPLQRELLEMLAAQAGIAIDNANLVEALRRERRQLAASEAAFRLAFNGAGTGMCMIGMADDRTRLNRVNPALCQLLGRDEDVLLSMRFADLIHPDDVDEGRAILVDAFGGAPMHDHELRCVRGDGEVVWVSATVSVVAGPPPFAIAQVQDITGRKAAEADLVRRASRDPLTGLVNREALAAPLDAAVRRAAGGGETSALLFCDLDDFKVVNDTFGHDAGDAVLVAVAQRLGSLVRPTDTVARLGGDEFVILTEDVPADDLAALVDRVERAVSAPIGHEGHALRVRVSVGVAVIDATISDAGAALRAADRAMYLVKGHRHASGVTGRVTAFGEHAGAPGGIPLLRLAGPDNGQ